MPVSLITASYDHRVVFWELGGAARRTLSFNESQVNCMCLSPDKTLLAVAGHASIRVYDASPNASAQNANSLGQTDGTQLSGNVTSMHFIDLSCVKGTRADEDATKGAAAAPRSTRTPPEYTLLVTSEDGSIKVFTLKTAVAPATSQQPQGGTQVTFALKHEVVTKVPITSATLFPNQQLLLTGTQLGRVSVWHMPAIFGLSGAMSTTATATTDAIDESQLNSATSNAAPATKPASGTKPIQELALEADPTSVRSIAVSPYGNFVAVATNIGRIHFFAFCRGESAMKAVLNPTAPTGPLPPLRPIRNSNPHFNQSLNPFALEEVTFTIGHEKYVLKIAIAPSCRYIVTASADYTVGIFGVPDYLASGQFLHFCDIYSHAAATPTSRSSGSPNADSGVVATVDAEPGENVLRFLGGVAAGLEDPRLRFPLRRTFLGHQRWVWDCCVSPCSGYILTVSSDHTGRLWKVDGDLSSPPPAPPTAETLAAELVNPRIVPPPSVVNSSIGVYNYHTKAVNCCLLDIDA